MVPQGRPRATQVVGGRGAEGQVESDQAPVTHREARPARVLGRGGLVVPEVVRVEGDDDGVGPERQALLLEPEELLRGAPSGHAGVEDLGGASEKPFEDLRPGLGRFDALAEREGVPEGEDPVRPFDPFPRELAVPQARGADAHVAVEVGAEPEPRVRAGPVRPAEARMESDELPGVRRGDTQGRRGGDPQEELGEQYRDRGPDRERDEPGRAAPESLAAAVGRDPAQPATSRAARSGRAMRRSVGPVTKRGG